MLLEGCYLCSMCGFISKRVVLQENSCFVSLCCLGFWLVLTVRSQGRASCVISGHEPGGSPLPHHPGHLFQANAQTHREETQCLEFVIHRRQPWQIMQIWDLCWAIENLSSPDVSSRMPPFVGPFQQLAEKADLGFHYFTAYFDGFMRLAWTFTFLHDRTDQEQRLPSSNTHLTDKKIQMAASLPLSEKLVFHWLTPPRVGERLIKLDDVASPLPRTKLWGKKKKDFE